MRAGRIIKPIAIALTFLVFALAVVGPSAAVGHDHHGATNHAMLHSSIICIWMCAASSFIGPEGNGPPFSLHLVELIEPDLRVLTFETTSRLVHSRAPPTSI